MLRPREQPTGGGDAEAEATVGGVNRLAMIVVVVAAAVAALLLNVLLLNRASAGSDPVGKLRPIANLVTQNLTPTPLWVVQPSSGPIEGDSRDD